MTERRESTRIVAAMCAEDRRDVDRLFELVYNDLRGVAHQCVRRLTAGQTFQPTDLVHQAYLKLVHHDEPGWRGKSHFLAVGAKAIRQILVDLARSRQSQKRGGDRHKVPFDDTMTVSVVDTDDVLAIDEALARLARVSESQARLVECRFFAGMTMEEIAEAFDIPKRTAEQQWTFAKAWLRREPSRGNDHDG